MLCPPALSFLGDMEFMLYILPPFVIYNPAVSSVFLERSPDVTISSRPRFSQATWRWFTSPRGRFTSRSGSSQCPRITSVSVCRFRTNCTFCSSCYLLCPLGTLVPTLPCPLSPFFSLCGTDGSRVMTSKAVALVFSLIDVSVPFCDVTEG